MIVGSPEVAVRPIASRSVAELVTSEIRRSILSGRLAPGQTFSLREIASMLDVSFIPVRDALRTLEGEGLIITRPGRSATVAPLNLDDLHAIYRVRRLLEPDIARRSCLTITDGELDRLDKEATEFGDESQSLDEIYDAHHSFHMALYLPSATAWDTRILSTLWRAGERYIRIGFGAVAPAPGETTRRQHAHVDLVEQFRLRDPDAAAHAVHDHLAHNEEIAIKGLAAISAVESDGPASPPLVAHDPPA